MNKKYVLKSKIDHFENNEYHRSIEILRSKEDGDKKSSFLLGQISNFNKKSPRWTEHVIKSCILWQYCSPKGYRYAREYVLTLPSSRTLTFCRRNMPRNWRNFAD